MSALYQLVLLLSVGCANYASAKVLLVSMDGFRWDYINNVTTPNFDQLARNGTRAPYINNPFVTKTFPCHYTLATGLYEESHGIVANSMYDPLFNETFKLSTTDTKWWDEGEPIWNTVRRHGLKSAVFFWPGSEAEVGGLRPNIWNKYNESVPYDKRIDTTIQWLTGDIDLALLYFEEPDSIGHLKGPYSQEVADKVKEMDGYLGKIVRKLDENDLWDNVTLIVTSDHGMAEVDETTRLVDLSKYIDLDAVDKCPEQGAFVNILPKKGKEDEIYQALLNVSHMRVFKKPDFPSRWHYQSNRRIQPILALADEGWLVALNASDYTYKGKRGTHGFDNNLMSMKPIFFARGPGIRRNFKADPFNSVDVYPLICHLLGVEPAPNNGSLENTRPFIMDYTSSAILASPSVLLLFMALISFWC